MIETGEAVQRSLSRSVDVRSLLIVDPNAPFRSSMRRAFADSGLAVFETGELAEAVRLAVKHTPDVVTCELYAGGTAHWEVLRSLREHCPHAAVVVITGFAPPAAAVSRAMQLGAAGVLSKPVSAVSVLAQATGELASAVGELQHLSLHRAMWEFINQTVLEAGSIAGAARSLNLHARSLRRMLKKVPPLR